MNPSHFDLVVLGSGSTAFAAALRAAALGRRAVLTEAGTLGGTCVNRGCVPSKFLIAMAEEVHRLRHPQVPGVAVRGLEVDADAIFRAKDDAIRRMRQKKYTSVAEGVEGIEVVRGRARLAANGTVEVDGLRLRGEAVLIATGSRPYVPAIEGLERVPFWTSDFLGEEEDETTKRLPRAIVIVGGGYIACELGQALSRLGSQVTLLARSRELLPGFEPEVGRTLLERFRAEGLRVELASEAVAVRGDGNGVEVTARRDGSTFEVRAERLLLAVGRRPNTDGLGLEEAGVRTDGRGFVETDDTLRTSRAGVWAAGDVTHAPMATPVGAHEGALAAENALTAAARKVDRRVIPRAVFTDPPVAQVGWTEAQARAHGLACRCRVVPLEHVPRAGVLGKTAGFVKVVIERSTERLVGVTMVGEAAHEVIHEAAMALRFGARLADLIETIHVYPTMAEALKVGALAFHRDVSRLSCCAE